MLSINPSLNVAVRHILFRQPEGHSMTSSRSSVGATGAQTSSTSPMPSTDRMRSVVVVFAVALGMAAGFAPVYFGTISVFLAPVSAEFGWGRGQASFGSVVSMLGLAVGALGVGRLIDRVGATRVIAVSTVLMGCAIALQSQGGGSFALYMSCSFLIGVAGAATTPPGYVSVLAATFDGRLGMALGLAGAGMGIGTVVAPIVAQSLITQFGWRTAYLILAAAAVVLGLCACAIISRFAVAGRSRSPQSRAATTEQGLSAREAVRDPLAWRLGAMVLLVSVATMGMSIHLVSILKDFEFSPSAAAGAASFGGVGVLLGRIVSGALIDRYAAPRVALWFFLVAAGGAVILATQISTSTAILYTAGVLIGFSMGAEGDFLPYFVRKYMGLRAFGTIFGAFFFIHSIGGVLGPYLFGLGYDAFESYVPSLWVAAGSLCLASALAASLGRYRYTGLPSAAEID